MMAGRSSGDLVHPLPYSPEMHFSEFASAVADMKNSSAVSARNDPDAILNISSSILSYGN